MDLPDRIVPDGLFVNPRGDNTEQVAQLVKALGLESIRLGFIWVNFEKTIGAPFDFTKHDRMMAEYRQAGHSGGTGGGIRPASGAGRLGLAG